MFGFLAPRQKISKWRQSYARVCQHQRTLFGLTSLPFLSYEATFLYQLGIDFQLIPVLSECAPTCCRLRRISNDDERQDVSAAMFASAFGMMLAGVKLDDDVIDSGRWFNRLARWKYRKAIATSHQILDGLSDGLLASIRSAIEEHKNLESSGCRDLDAYCQPTAEGFGQVFRSFAAAVSKQKNDAFEEFAEIGRHLGAAIIAWDCAVDFQKDQIKGEYNPLANDIDVRRSFDFCLLQLAEIGWLLPEGSTSAAVIASVSDRVRIRRNSNVEHPVKTFERWGFLRQKGRAYAKCDGCDALCLVGDCCECLGGGAEAAGGCAECGSTGGCGCPCFDVIFCCGGDDPCAGNSKKKTSKQGDKDSSDEPPAFAWCHGKEGIVDDTLNPGGFVLVDGERIIAKSASGRMMVVGTHCKVVGTDPFGITVEPL